jgi:hypothetical protein
MILKRALPFLCFICGLAGAYNIDSAPSFYPGILLMLIACIIWMKRLENQHDHFSYSESTQKLSDSMHSTTALSTKP